MKSNKVVKHVLSASIIEEIKIWEGYRDKAYKDAAVPPIWTIGYGHTKGVKQGWLCTKEQAEAWLREDLATAESIVAKWFTCDLTQGMYDALVSFVYNTGPGAKNVKDGLIYLKNGNHSTLFKKTMAGDYIGAAEEFKKWTRAGSVHLKGLVLRREKEREYYLKDIQAPKDFEFVVSEELSLWEKFKKWIS